MDSRPEDECRAEADGDDYVAPSIVDIDTASDREFAVLPGGNGSTDFRN